jgi:hypothetical protein
MEEHQSNANQVEFDQFQERSSRQDSQLFRPPGIAGIHKNLRAMAVVELSKGERVE